MAPLPFSDDAYSDLHALLEPGFPGGLVARLRCARDPRWRGRPCRSCRKWPCRHRQRRLGSAAAGAPAAGAAADVAAAGARLLRAPKERPLQVRPGAAFRQPHLPDRLDALCDRFVGHPGMVPSYLPCRRQDGQHDEDGDRYDERQEDNDQELLRGSNERGMLLDVIVEFGAAMPSTCLSVSRISGSRSDYSEKRGLRPTRRSC